MSVIEVLFRVDAICQKYEKYDIDKQRELNAYGDDAFARLYASVDSTIQEALKVPFSSLLIFVFYFLVVYLCIEILLVFKDRTCSYCFKPKLCVP